MLDADRFSHQILELPDVRRKIQRRWGPEVLAPDGSVDRRALAERAFRSRSDARAINAIVHPPVRKRIRRELESLKASGPRLIVLDAALLLEAGSAGLCDAVAYVHAPRRLREARVRRRGWAPGELRRRERFQFSPRAKRRAADVVLNNGATLRDLARQVRALYIALTGA